MQTESSKPSPFDDNRPVSSLSIRRYAILRFLMASDYGGNVESIGDHVAYYLRKEIEHEDVIRDLAFLCRNGYCLRRPYVTNFNPTTYHILQKGGQHVLNHREPSESDEPSPIDYDFSAPFPYLHLFGITIYWSKHNLKRKHFSWWLDWHITRRWQE